MIRNLKILGLALVAVFAMSAMAASAALAEEDADFWATEVGDLGHEGLPAVTIDSEAEGAQEFETSAGLLSCSVLDGHAQYEIETKELTATDIGFTNCTATKFGITFPATVTPEENCHFDFTAGTYTDGSDDSHGSVHICDITIDVFNSPHPGGSKRCEIHVPAQEVTGLTYTNITTEGGVMAVTLDVDNVEVKNVTITDFNTLGCNNHVTETSTYDGDVLFKATNEAEQYVDATVTGTNP